MWRIVLPWVCWDYIFSKDDLKPPRKQVPVNNLFIRNNAVDMLIQHAFWAAPPKCIQGRGPTDQDVVYSDNAVGINIFRREVKKDASGFVRF